MLERPVHSPRYGPGSDIPAIISNQFCPTAAALRLEAGHALTPGKDMAKHLAIIDFVDAADPDTVTVGAAAPEAGAAIGITEFHGAGLGELIFLVIDKHLTGAAGHVAASVINVGFAVGIGDRVGLGTVEILAGAEILIGENVSDGIVAVGL